MTRCGWARLRPWLLAVSGYSLLTLVCTWPLARRLATAVPHDAGDPLLTTWILWWNAHTAPLTDAWWNVPMFWPMSGALALSEQMLGLSLFASPLQWLGADPVTAYNVLFLLSFPLCAVSAHALAYTLTARHDAAALAGIVFAFNPYRISQLAHLHVLWVFWMPLALLALHRYARDRRWRWLLLFAAMWVGQALSNAYFLLFFPILVALWAMWFLAARGGLSSVTAIAAAWCAGAIVLLPIAIPYQRLHERMGLQRKYLEVATYSADLSALAAASPLVPASRLLPTTGNAEQQLFPGITVVFLIAIAAVVSRWSNRNRPPPARTPWVRLLFGGAACGFAALAILVELGRTWQLRAGPFTIASVTTAIKPLTAAIWCALFAIAIGGSLARAWRARSTLAFYVCAAMAMYVLSFGPEPSFLGAPFWYRPPYAWLMDLAGFSNVRAPARFAMLAELCLAIAAALAFVRIRDALPRRAAAAASVAVLCCAVADGWIPSLPLADLPPRLASLESTDGGPLVELPIGDVMGDIAAMYRSMYHRRPIVNGYSGFEPTHYSVLRVALDTDGLGVFEAMTSRGPLTVVVPSSGLVTTIPASDPGPALSGHPLPVRAVAAGDTIIDRTPLIDGDRLSRWDSGSPQHGRETMTIDLGSVQRVAGVTLCLGPYLADFPRVLAIESSDDRQSWAMRWSGRTAVLAVAGAVRDPRVVPLTVAFAPEPARWVRLRQLGSDPRFHWSIADLTVFGR
jgi:hypothetical protein